MSARRLVVAIFVLSGLAGLVYEVVWSRQLVLVFGNTSQAVSAILTGFFGGMAIGNAVGGWIADRVRRPLALYGILEVVVAVIALATPHLFQASRDLYAGAFVQLAGQPEQLALVRFGVALLALGPATVLLGATLPTLTRHLVRQDAGIAHSFARLYAANTIGALLGTVLAGFVLIEVLGLQGTLQAGAICSAVAGFGALLLDLWIDGSPDAPVSAPEPAPRFSPATERPARAGAAATRGAPVGSATAAPVDEEITDSGRPAASMPPLVWMALGFAFVSGLTSLGYQTLWNRLLSSGTGNSTYVFAMILAIFLAGLAIGSLLYSVARRRRAGGSSVLPALATCQALIALLAIAGLALVIAHPTPIQVEGDDVRKALGMMLAPIFWVVLPPTIVMGFSLPLAAELLGGAANRAGTRTGLLLALNTLGSIAGTFVLPFFVVPAIGSSRTVWALAALNVALATLLLARWRAGQRRAPGWGRGQWTAMTTARRRGMAAGAVTLLAGLAIVAVPLVPGATRDPGEARIIAAGGTLFASAEDEIAAVQAGFVGGPQLWVGGVSMTAMTIDTRLMPALSLAIRPNAKRALVIAFGMGSAYRSSLIAGLDTTGVELVPSVPSMMRWFFRDAAAVLANPAGRVVIADGRNFVELTQERFDLVVVDPPPPVYSAGVSVISSLEFYRAAKARLAPGGLMMQWVPYGQDMSEFRAHVRTFAAVFPHVMVIRGPGGYGTFMYGADDPLALDPDALAAVVSRPEILADLSAVGDTPTRTVDGWKAVARTMVWIRDGEARTFTGPGPLVTDDRPLPEYFLLRRFAGTPPG